jgi:hypothetical protein
MDSVEAYIYERLTTSSAVIALLGNRIEPSMSSEMTVLPRVVYTRLSGQTEIFLGGESGLGYYLIQYDVFAKTYAQMNACAEAIRNRLSGFRGHIALNAIARMFFVVRLDATRDSYIAPVDGSDTPLYRRSMDFFIGSEEPVPNLTA